MAGRRHRAREEAAVEQMHDRVLGAADILVDRQPARGLGRLVGASAFHGSVKRAMYQDESTKVSMVSVSRRAGLPHCGQATCFQVGWRSSGLPGWSKSTSSGSVTGRSAVGHRHHAAGLAVDHRDRAAPVALARDAPVAQAEIHLPLRRPGGCRATSRFEPPRHVLLRFLDRHAVEEARIDHPAVAFIGGVGDDERSRDPGPAGRPPAWRRARIC